MSLDVRTSTEYCMLRTSDARHASLSTLMGSSTNINLGASRMEDQVNLDPSHSLSQ